MTIDWYNGSVFLFQEAKEVKVLECKIFSSYAGTGIAVLTATHRICVVNSVDDPRIRRLSEIPGE